MKLNGIAASEGIGVGNIKVVVTGPRQIEPFIPKDVEAEITRFDEALAGFCEDTEKMADELEEAASAQEAGILRGHVQLIQDPFLLDQIRNEIRTGVCAESATEKNLNNVIDMFNATGD